MPIRSNLGIKIGSRECVLQPVKRRFDSISLTGLECVCGRSMRAIRC